MLNEPILGPIHGPIGIPARAAGGIDLTKAPVIKGANKVSWGHSGSEATAAGIYEWTVPAGIYAIRVKIWGSGGASGFSDATYRGGHGGGGGYAEALIHVVPGQVLYIIVGLAGQAASLADKRTNYGGAGVSFTTTADDPGGGGFCAVMNTLHGMIIAGGGGAGSNRASTGVGQQGGAGGGDTGEDGQIVGGTGVASGGSQTQGGVPGNSRSDTEMHGCHLQGGRMRQSLNGPNGGGGLFGGGAGVGSTGATLSASAAGGSGHVPTSAFERSSLQGSGQTPANNTDADYPSGAGLGGTGVVASQNDGALGHVLITY